MAKWPNSDQETMTTIQKGEILYLDSVGKTKKQIAGTTGRSMEWIELVIGALAGTGVREDLIEKYKKAIPAKKSTKETKNELLPSK